jgi:membrane fusion protein (multidrug efflux system)
LADMRIGQPATMFADLYGDKVVYHGRLLGIGAGTGSVFSLLPAQNATGNWIKIVQRIPARISLDGQELARNPLRVGLSLRVTVDTHDRDGRVLAESTPAGPVYSTPVYDSGSADVEALIDKIIANNRVQSPLGAPESGSAR